jgi:hypothetical protein
MLSCFIRPENPDVCRHNLEFTICGTNLPICKIVATAEATETGVLSPIEFPTTSKVEDNGIGMIVGIVIAGLLAIAGLFELSYA